MFREMAITAAVALTAAFVARFAVAGKPLSTTKSVVELFCDQSLPVTADSSAILAEAARKLLESSEYNSHSPRWSFPISELHEEFHQALVGEHLRVVFDAAQKIESRGGTLRVREIIVRLSSEARTPPFPDRFTDSVFTIDDNQDVVGYALYSGTKEIELWRAVTQMTGGKNVCRVPLHVPDMPETNTR